MRLNILSFSTAVAFAFTASTALANNEAVEKALQEKPELSTFYSSLQKTGVLAELKDDQSYTIFAPTNAAFAKLSQKDYPCLYSDQCRPQIAEILRNHFVPGQVTFSGPITNTLFSVNQTNINLGTTNGEVRNVAGHRIVKRGQLLSGSVLCEINGVITTPEQLASVTMLRYVQMPTPEYKIEKTVTDKVYYAPDGTPDGVSRMTTFTNVPVSGQTTTTTVTPAQPQE